MVNVTSRTERLLHIVKVLDLSFVFNRKSTNNFLPKQNEISTKAFNLFLGKRRSLYTWFYEHSKLTPNKILLYVKKINKFLDSHPKMPILLEYYESFNNKRINLICDCYLTRFTRQIISFDTTRLAPSWYVTFLIHHASRIILTYFKTTQEST